MHAGTFDLGYVASTGDFNQDGRTDIYLTYRPEIVMISYEDLPIPVPLSKRTMEPFVLQQNANQGFDLITAISNQQKADLERWVISEIRVILDDANADGNQDLLLQNIASVIPGALDTFVYAPDATASLPSAVRSIDSRTKTFIRDMNGFGAAPDHYFDNAWVTDVIYLPWRINVYDCGGEIPDYRYAWDGTFEDATYSLYCLYVTSFTDQRPFPVQRFDDVNYSVPAYNLSESLREYIVSNSPSVNVSAEDAEFTRTVMQDVFGVPFARGLPITATGEIVIEGGAHGSIWKQIGMFFRGSWIIGAIFYPSEVGYANHPNDSLYFHYTYFMYAPKVITGIKAGGWVVLPPLMNAFVAQDKLALPIHLPGDPPPQCYFEVWVPNSAPRVTKFETPVVYHNFGMTVQRNGGAITTQLPLGTKAGSVSGPFTQFPPL